MAGGGAGKRFADSQLWQVGVLGSEKLIVNVTKLPDECGAIRTQQGDVLEVKYTGYLAETMEVT